MIETVEKFKKKFARLEVSMADAALLAKIDELSVSVDKEQKKVFLKATFPEWTDPKGLFSLEDAIRKAYDLAEVRFFPTYPPESFREECVHGLILLLNRVVGQGVGKGFLEESKIRYTPSLQTLEIRVRQGISADFVQ